MEGLAVMLLLDQLQELLEFGFSSEVPLYVRVIALLIRAPVEVDSCVRLAQRFGLCLAE